MIRITRKQKAFFRRLCVTYHASAMVPHIHLQAKQNLDNQRNKSMLFSKSLIYVKKIKLKVKLREGVGVISNRLIRMRNGGTCSSGAHQMRKLPGVVADA